MCQSMMCWNLLPPFYYCPFCQPTLAPLIPSHNEPEKYETKSNEAAHNNTITSLFCRYPANQRIDSRYLTRCQCDPALNIGQRLALYDEAVVDGVRLAEDAVRHVVAVVDAVALFKHVIGLCSLGVVGAVLVNIGADIGEEVGTVARLLELAAQPD